MSQVLNRTWRDEIPTPEKFLFPMEYWYSFSFTPRKLWMISLAKQEEGSGSCANYPGTKERKRRRWGLDYHLRQELLILQLLYSTSKSWVHGLPAVYNMWRKTHQLISPSSVWCGSSYESKVDFCLFRSISPIFSKWQTCANNAESMVINQIASFWEVWVYWRKSSWTSRIIIKEIYTKCGHDELQKFQLAELFLGEILQMN